MKLSSALLWCLPALSLTSAAAIDNRDLASTILKEFESAASCAGCEVRLFQLFTFRVGFQILDMTHKKVLKFLVTCHTFFD